jgi:ribosome-associated toxin RatA of RatAB toxin-antitoxin module
MEKKYEEYFNFIKTMLILNSSEDESTLSLDVKMKMIKEQTRVLLDRELTDYANEMTEQHNKYVEKLRAKLS